MELAILINSGALAITLMEEMLENRQKITGDMTIGEVVKLYPQCIEIMLEYGLHCVGCGANAMETLEQGSMGHGMPEETFEEMIEKLNAAIIDATGKTLTLTPKAVTKLKDLFVKQQKEDWGLRIKVNSGGCAGKEYKFSFEKEHQEGDTVIVEDGVKVFVDPESAQYLEGSLVDYIETLQESGFRISNPHANASCGCGKSFA